MDSVEADTALANMALRVLRKEMGVERRWHKDELHLAVP